MKNQYFGDINDYRKYGLLRCIVQAGGFRLLVAWMLTPNDDGPDGRFVSYLDDSNKWSKYDPVLFHSLKGMLAKNQVRQVSHIEKTDLLGGADYFSKLVPDARRERDIWSRGLNRYAQKNDLIFLDPDTGLEIKSTPFGRKDSSKYVFWREISHLWSSGKSLLIYQQFPHENRAAFTERMLESLSDVAAGAFVEAFSTPYVVFLLALQPEHRDLHEAIVRSVQVNWAGQINHWEQTFAL